MSQHFTHLHLHTDYSLLDGAISLDRLVEFAKAQQFKSLAMTDHGNIFGAVKFFEKCKKSGIKPILGMEAYLTEDAKIKSPDKKYYHLILLVENERGYQNLCKLISYSFQEGFYFKPRIDYAILEKYSEGLIATSACLGGHIPRLLMENKQEEAYKRLDWFLDVFGPERFYLEVQPEDQRDQTILNNKLLTIASERNIRPIATGDCHYINEQDREAHEVMLAIQTQDKMDNPNRYTFGDCKVYVRSTEQMLECFKNNPEAVWNTGIIADRCNFEFQTGKLFFPKFEIPETYTQETYFKHLCLIGFEKLKAEKRFELEREAEYRARLELEADLIITMGFVGYFLVVSDFIQWSKRNGIPVGPGRGSAAGSLVAWALEITNIDPIKYNLLFERFLNPERVSMPDIDIDFCINGRERVINYVRDRYGHDKVCQIITFGTMMAKGAIKDVARALSFPFEDSNAITDLIPDQLKITLKEALEQEPRLQQLIDNNPKAHKLFDIAFKLEGLTRHASKHAAGIVISPEPIDQVLPVYVPAKSTELVTQYAMTELETLGFLKMDLLGLKNLTLIDNVLKLIYKIRGISLNIDTIPLDDKAAFALMCAGKTSGVFQLESDGLKEVLRKLQPDKFEDIIAVNALYRPGPLGSGMVDDYIERRHGRQKIQYLFPELEPILDETYGVIVYQEQVIKIASTIGGYSLGEADILRRAMGKKKADVMAQQRAIFLERAQSKGFDATKAGELFDLMAYFAGYGFNKSHSAAYALIAYQTAYLKANYTSEFMACLISLDTDDTDKMAFYIAEAKDLSIQVIPPDINRSEIEFSVDNNAIVFGLRGIKNLGMAALENIMSARSKGPFIDMLDLCIRIDLRTANKRVLENLASSGALDCLPGTRAQKYSEVAKIIELAAQKQKSALTGQMDLFGLTKELADPTATNTHEQYIFGARSDWTDKEKLEKELEVVGCYLSNHPLETYQSTLKAIRPITFAQGIAQTLQNSDGKEPWVVSCGLIKSKKEILTKKGERMAFLQLEDQSGTAEVIIFPKLFSTIEHWLSAHHVFVVKGTVDLASTVNCKIKATAFVPIELVWDKWPASSHVSLELPTRFDIDFLQSLKTQLPQGTIPLHFRLTERETPLRITTTHTLQPTAEWCSQLETLGVRVQYCLE